MRAAPSTHVAALTPLGQYPCCLEASRRKWMRFSVKRREKQESKAKSPDSEIGRFALVADRHAFAARVGPAGQPVRADRDAVEPGIDIFHARLVAKRDQVIDQRFGRRARLD